MQGRIPEAMSTGRHTHHRIDGGPWKINTEVPRIAMFQSETESPPKPIRCSTPGGSVNKSFLPQLAPKNGIMFGTTSLNSIHSCDYKIFEVACPSNPKHSGL